MSDGARFALFDGDGGGALLLTEPQQSLPGEHSSGPLAVFQAIEAAQAAGQWVALAADYELGASFEPAVTPPSRGRPVLRAWAFGRSRWLDSSALRTFLAEQLEALPEHQRLAGIAELSNGVDAPKFAAQVSEIRRWIADGDCYQINLTFPLTFRIYGHPLALYAALRERQPVRYGGYLRAGEETILSFSPELFFQRTGSRVLARPMKGTAARGETPAEDQANRAALLASAKERAENVMIVDLLRNDLGRLAQPGKVSVEALCEVEAYPTLWQMVSTVAADLPGVPLANLFGALFPCGSITGAPKIRAMQRIGELEGASRGLYTGSLGWLSPGGDCRFNVAIRSVEVGPHQRGTLGVGSGIVIDAEPAREYAECLLKASFLTAFDPGFELLETLRLEDGEYPLLSLHLERLQDSARHLGFRCSLAAVSSVLAEEAAARQAGLHRVRLTLAHDGRCAAQVSPLANHPASTGCVVLAAERLPADDYLRAYKTTARARYDRALAAVAARPEVFDVIFLNSRGEVCEGARSNVFVERDGVLLTPPAACGLLPGVMRRRLLESGRAVEKILCREDLRQAPALYVGNALRGLMPVRLVQ
ncbi:MAG: aminodeoxychorismate synthase component I [Candidatus Accumulibacter sp.]|uniref:aminodeoxychorismate synthase component I n=1 Tax=Accumulibacter sp. TaxID=2053492 RepID=UPI0025F080C7|nr:aminodeoxychorismate synthase component I [Accumulibacter sp.]MCP5247517.1 aminodeoxychorismate synthase component I [Accumulibacter sp.]